MSEYDYDLFVIGAGSGGTRAARAAAARGARVAVAEERYLGGTCVNVGCVPKKLLVHASHVRDELAEAVQGYGWRIGERSFDWPTFVANKDREIARLNGVYAKLLDEAGVERIDGRAVFADPHTLAVAGRRVTAAHVLVATGGWPTRPGVPGVEHAITSNEAFHLASLPRRIVIVGGGYVAVEFAGIFNGLGVETVQLHRGPLFLRGFDDDVRQHLAGEMRKKGIELRFGTHVRALEPSSDGLRGAPDDGLRVTLTDGSTVEAEQVMFATGRHPNTAGLGLGRAGVRLARDGSIPVDAYSRTNVPHVHAIGDVTHRLALTPVAIHEAMAFAETVFGGNPTKPDHTGVPTAVFSQPPIGTVGLTEAQARQRHGAIDVYRSAFRALKHTLTGSEEQTFMKLLVDRASDRVVGLHVVGPDAAEMVQGFAVALKCGATKAQFDATVGIHPTAAEELVTMRERAS
jgi:glutathione reductase (NADPH)